MAHSIIQAIEGHLDPTTVSNAIYETMVEWRSLTIKINTGEPRKTRNKDRRANLEVLMARFLGMEHHEVRDLLRKHFDMPQEYK